MSATRDFGCPPDEELAAYIDGRLDDESRRRIERHAVECEDCRSALGDAVVSLSTYRARPRIGRHVHAGLAAAAAAAVLLFAVRPATLFRDEPPPVRSSSATSPENVARFATLEPADDAVLPRNALTFRWEMAVPGAVYRLTLSDERGGVVWHERTEGTSLAMPSTVVSRLTTGAVYYWRVEALHPDLSTAATALRSFRMREH